MSEDNTKGLKVLFDQIHEKLSKVFGDIKVQEMSYDDIIVRVQAALNTMDTQTAIHYVQAVYDDYVIYEVYPGGEVSGTSEIELLKRGYTIGKDDGVVLDNDVTPVTKQIKYVELTNQSSHDADHDRHGGETKMADKKESCCPEKVTQLIENAATKFTEDDRVWLELLEEEQIDKMIPEVPAKEEVKENEAELKENEAKENEAEVKKEEVKTHEEIAAPTLKDLLDSADPKVKEKIEYGFQTYDARRSELITLITNREDSPWSAEDLESKSIAELEKLGKWATSATHNYQGQGGGSFNTNEEEPLEAVGFDYGVKVK